MKTYTRLFVLLLFVTLFYPTYSFNFTSIPTSSIFKGWITITQNVFSKNEQVPIMIVRAPVEGPTVGLVSTIHGNEVNGIAVIHEFFSQFAPSQLKRGMVIAIPVINTEGFARFQRTFGDGQDLNRIMPGSFTGNRGSVFAANFFEEVVKKFDYMFDLHTASFGNLNSLYVKVDLSCKRCCRMAKAQNAQIVLHDKGGTGFMRTEAQRRNISAITVELGHPQVFIPEFAKRSATGILNYLSELDMLDYKRAQPQQTVFCSRSYWIHTKKGGVLRVIPELTSFIKKGDLIATVYNLFGDIEERIYAPEDGIVISKAQNPVCTSGCRVIQLGIVDKTPDC